MKLSRRLALALMIVLVALAAWLLTTSSSPPRPVRLPDGSVLTYFGSTYGTNHVLSDASPIQQHLARLPAPVHAWIARLFRFKPVSTLARVTSTPMLVLWFEFDTRAAASTNSPLSRTSVWFADERGYSAGEDQWVFHYYAGTGQPPVRSVSTAYSVFPRRSRTIRIHIGARGEGNTLQPITTFSIANPDRRAANAWRAEDLPVTKHSRDLQCTLTHVATGYGNGGSFRGTPQGTVLVARDLETGPTKQTELGLHFEQPGTVSNNWTVADVRLADDSGNDIGQRSLDSTTRDERLLTLFHPSLWPDERAWRLTLFAKRTKEAAFTADELITFTNVPLPAPGTDLDPALPVATRGKTTMTLSNVKFRRTPHPSLPNGYESCEFVLLVTDLDRDWYFDLIAATDDNGRALTRGPFGASRSDHGTSRFYIGFVNVSPNAKVANLTFALQQGRKFEFFVKPELVTKENAPPLATPVAMNNPSPQSRGRK